jgi:carbonic anhydrase
MKNNTGKLIIISAILLSILSYGFPKSAALFTPEMALDRLKTGNIQYLNSLRNSSIQEPVPVSNSQSPVPFTAVLSCIDMPGAVESLFSLAGSEMYMVHSPGNTVSQSEILRLEQGVTRYNIPLIVILGHSGCETIVSALKEDSNGISQPLQDELAPSVKRARSIFGNKFSEELLDESIKLNVFQTMENILKKNSTIAVLAKSGRIKLVGAVCHTDNSRVEWLGAHPMQKFILENISTAPEAKTAIDKKTTDKPAKPGKKKAKKPASVEKPEKIIDQTVQETHGKLEMDKPLTVKFIFTNGNKMYANPRAPLPVTLEMVSKSNAKYAYIMVYAEGIKSQKQVLIYEYSKARFADGKCKIHFDWAAEKIPSGYVKQGKYLLLAKVSYFDGNKKLVYKETHYTAPRERYTITVE